MARRRAAKLLLVAGSLILSLLVIEGLVRLSGSYRPDPPLYPGEREAVVDAGFDRHTGWKLPPSAEIPESRPGEFSVIYRSNAQGFRSPHDFDAPKTGRRIALLGDSYTFGSGVPYGDTFAARLEAALPDTEVFNFGVGGWGIDQMWMALRHHALPREPDLVLVAFIRQDFNRSLSAYRLGHAWLEKPTFRWRNGELRRLTAADRPPPAWRAIVRESRLIEVLRRVDISLTRRQPWTYRWRLNRAIFAAMQEDAAAAGVPLAAVHLPTNNRRPVPYLEAEFQRLGIPFLDVTPLLPAEADPLYYPVDRHFTAAGHALVAGALVELVDRLGVGSGRDQYQ